MRTITSEGNVMVSPDILKEVICEDKVICIKQKGWKPVYLISEKALDYFGGLEDRYLAEAGEKALKEFEKSGEDAIPLEIIKSYLGIGNTIELNKVQFPHNGRPSMAHGRPVITPEMAKNMPCPFSKSEPDL